ncbi:Squalene/phytoene synthase [Trema orientale]|uniref:Squalene/phytoene synthase n=1 Tax=Trema orientale TaxID=63057 RepID=A0A2P5EXX5_TREOI|nr:Squalene/phytoene synthase [Trema orientale]
MENKKVSEKILELKKEVKRNIIEVNDSVKSPSEKLELIDAIQRLGVSYYFEKEIEAVLLQMYNNLHDYDDQKCCDDDGLYIVALRFRLLRQQGHNASSDVFNKFKNNEGKFENSLASDIRGMLNLYEAAQLRVHGEKILDDAFIFTTTHLESIASQLSSPLLDQVNHSLKHPIRKSLQRREARHYMSMYHQDASHSEILLTLAKLDFNLLQKMHQKELSDITRWWKDFDYRSKQSFSRDRIVECYFWTLGVFFEAQNSRIRMIITKLIAILTIIDDIYDSFGTLEELEPFTEAIERFTTRLYPFTRWDICAVDQLPEYMKLCYKALLDLYIEIEEFSKGRSYCVGYAKKGLQKQVRAYFHEAKWLHQKHIPMLDEYMPIGLNNAGSFLLIVMAFIGMGDGVTKDSLDWVFTDPEPKMVRSMSIVGRVMNDIAYHKSDQRRSGHIVASAVECHMKQYGSTEQDAIDELSQQVSDAWKDLNEECLYPTTIPMPLLMRVIDLVRVNHEMYSEGDGFTQGMLLKDLLVSLLINPYIDT